MEKCQSSWKVYHSVKWEQENKLWTKGSPKEAKTKSLSRGSAAACPRQVTFQFVLAVRGKGGVTHTWNGAGTPKPGLQLWVPPAEEPKASAKIRGCRQQLLPCLQEHSIPGTLQAPGAGKNKENFRASAPAEPPKPPKASAAQQLCRTFILSQSVSGEHASFQSLKLTPLEDTFPWWLKINHRSISKLLK